MRTALVGVIGLLFLVAVGCIPSVSDQMFLQAMQGKTVTTEQGATIDESKAKNIQIGVHRNQDIETWFGKPGFKSHSDDPNHPHPDGCVEMWTYMHTLIKQWGSIQARKSLMVTETLSVEFNKDGTVCAWSLMGSPQDMTSMSMESIQGRAIDESMAKNIKNGVQTIQDIEKWFGHQSRWALATGRMTRRAVSGSYGSTCILTRTSRMFPDNQTGPSSS